MKKNSIIYSIVISVSIPLHTMDVDTQKTNLSKQLPTILYDFTVYNPHDRQTRELNEIMEDYLLGLWSHNPWHVWPIICCP